MTDLYLSLRNYRHQLKAVPRPRGPGTMLVRFYPSPEHPRTSVVEQWGLPARSERQRDNVTIDIPVSQREQTVLNAQMRQPLRALLASDALLPPIPSRRSATGGRAPRIPPHLDSSIPPPATCPARRCARSGFAADIDNRRARHGMISPRGR